MPFDVEAFIAQQRTRFEAGMTALSEHTPGVPEDKTRFLLMKVGAIADQCASVQTIAESIAKLVPSPDQPPAQMRGPVRSKPQAQPPTP